MPNIKSAKKRVKVTAKKAAINKANTKNTSKQTPTKQHLRKSNTTQ